MNSFISKLSSLFQLNQNITKEESYMDKNEYGVINKTSIFQYSIPDSSCSYRIFERAFPTNPIKGIKFHSLDSGESVKTIAPMIIKEESGNQDNIFIIDLSNEYIGNYFFAGLIVDSITEFDKFITDLKTGKIILGIINIELTKSPSTIGKVVEQLTTLCGNNATPIVHIFLPKTSLDTTVNNINNSMGEYFLRSEVNFGGGDGE